VAGLSLMPLSPQTRVGQSTLQIRCAVFLVRSRPDLLPRKRRKRHVYRLGHAGTGCASVGL